MSKKALTIALKILFAAAVACWVIALIASVGLAHYTVEKMKDIFGS